ncbi:MAG: hypothetical protein ACD_79C00041G0003 [uncultured bacterium]|nr:MAG: hypothetical protein ACD_79C00041G0003 [uncultured bacterium]
MNIKEIKQLLTLINEHGIAEFELEREGTKIGIKKYSSAPAVMSAPIYSHAPSMHAIDIKHDTNETFSKEEKKVDLDAGLHSITSPIVGTFYSAPSPDASPYVSIGSKIGPNDTVCIVEAMKVMNEIKADVAGIIEKIEVENGQAVEFGQVLFKVRK